MQDQGRVDREDVGMGEVTGELSRLSTRHTDAMTDDRLDACRPPLTKTEECRPSASADVIGKSDYTSREHNLAGRQATLACESGSAAMRVTSFVSHPKPRGEGHAAVTSNAAIPYKPSNAARC
ncbi:hypothetical protein BaRGS_00040258, partial [Batillaria attramentaria]